ncbi:FAD-binding monooxygenase moxY [Fusarium oxysporum f. sp. albedinis]|nr:FAD-binding monooxygenase moxY [Fusarium oxysporum f. sp. albedinis]
MTYFANEPKRARGSNQAPVDLKNGWNRRQSGLGSTHRSLSKPSRLNTKQTLSHLGPVHRASATASIMQETVARAMGQGSSTTHMHTHMCCLLARRVQISRV